jgi:cell division protein FtsN
MNSPEQTQDVGTLDAAIVVCDQNIHRHSRLAAISMMSGVILLGVLVWFAGYYAHLTAGVRDKERFSLLSNLNEKLSALRENQNDSTLRYYQSERDTLEKAKPGQNAPDEEKKAWQAKLDDAQKKLTEAVENNRKRQDAARADLASAQKAFDEYDSGALLSQELMLGLVALSGLIISVFTALYRLHQKEMAKNEHYKLGFSRVRVAANNAEREGFKSEVRSALTMDAFSAPLDGFFGRKGKVLESPLPGHPASELATGMINKILDQVEVILKPKDK